MNTNQKDLLEEYGQLVDDNLRCFLGNGLDESKEAILELEKGLPKYAKWLEEAELDTKEMQKIKAWNKKAEIVLNKIGELVSESNTLSDELWATFERRIK